MPRELPFVGAAAAGDGRHFSRARVPSNPAAPPLTRSTRTAAGAQDRSVYAPQLALERSHSVSDSAVPRTEPPREQPTPGQLELPSQPRIVPGRVPYEREAHWRQELIQRIVLTVIGQDEFACAGALGGGMMVRIAFVIGGYPSEERARREQVALSYATPEIEVGIVTVDATPYLFGLTPAEVQLAATPFIAAFRKAEQAGYDAIVPLGTLDLGVDGGKSVVDIPVVGPTEAMLHLAPLVGERFGMIVYHRGLLPMMRAIVRRYGMQGWVAGIRDSGFDLPDIAANRDAMVENFLASARLLIEQDGADVILPMGITQCPVHMKPAWLQEQLGVPVVEGFGAPIRLAATLAALGIRPSRVRWPKSRSFDA